MSLNATFLTQIAPSMKRAAAVTAVAVVVACALLFLAVLPSRSRIRLIRTELASINGTIDKMRTEIKGTEQQKAKNAAAADKRDALIASGVIEPLLGSFAMRGKSLLDPLAQKTGFVIDNVRELSFIPLQVPKPAPEQLYARQPIEFTGHGTYDQITAFITRAEASQPLVSLSGLLILSQPQTPETHTALVTFEWPIKGEKRLPAVKTGK